MICMEEPCECPSLKATKGTAKKKKTTIPKSDTVGSSEKSPSAKTTSGFGIDLKAAMKAAAQTETNQSSVPSDPAHAPVDAQAYRHEHAQEALSADMIRCMAVLSDILHPDEIKPHQATIWKERRNATT